MKQRCLNPNSEAYKHYGGRGITICEEWKNNFYAFVGWAFNNGYSEELTLDRIDNNGNYCPDNCRWATRLEQAQNQRTNVVLTLNGETHTISEWSRITGIPRTTIQNRIYAGKDVKYVLTFPSKKGNNQYNTEVTA